MLKGDIIEPSTSKWAAPVVILKKKNGQFRFAVDYRKLNKVTVPMSFPLPHMESVFDAIGECQAQYFSSLDLKSGFWQVPLSESSKHKSAFVTQTGIYQFKRMPFGLMNSPITFQAMMSHVLRGLNWKFVLVYVDDILIFSRNFEDHLSHLSQVFERLHHAKLKLHPDKCKFAVKDIKFLGHIISREGVKVDPSKTKSVSEFPTPKNVKQVRSFLGMANYYRRFIKDHSKIISPLNALCRKGTTFKWSTQCQHAFDTMKKALISAPVLAYPNMAKPFILTCDASDTAIGYVLGQLDEQNREYAVAYGNKSLSKEQRKWNVSEKECYAILKGIEAYRPYLANSHFTVVTDHSALCWLKSSRHTGKLERWALSLQPLNFDIVHREGKSNGVADCLSRYPNPFSLNKDTEEIIVSEKKDSLPEISSLENSHINDNEHEIHNNDGWTTQVVIYYEGEDVEGVPSISAIDNEEVLPNALNDKVSLSQLQKQCADFAGIFKYLETETLPDDRKERDKIVSESKYYSIADGILHHRYQRRCKKADDKLKYIIQIALPSALRHDALKSYHDSLASGGHLGVEKVMASLIEKYWWPHMHQDIIDYVKSCDRCQRAKRDFNPNKPPLTKMPQVGRFDRWHIDVLGPLTKTAEGFEYILVIVDAFTRWTEAFPLKTQSAKEIATVLYNEVVARYGSPRVLLSDRGQAFMSKLIKAMCEIFQITQHHTSSYHPNTNGTVERQNSTIAQTLRMYCDNKQTNWPSLLPSIMMAFRRAPSAATGYSPFYMMFGKEMKIPFDIALEPKDSLPQETADYLKQFMSNLKVAHQIAQENEALSKEKDKVRHDKNAKIPKFGIGDLVLLRVHKVQKGLSKKLTDKSEGPYRIVEIGPNFTYLIRRDNKGPKSLVNATNLKLYIPPERHRQKYTQNDDANIDPDLDSDSNEDELENEQEQNVEGETDQQPQPVIDPHTRYEVKKVIKGRYRRGRREMYVKWLDNTCTWEPDVSFDQDMLEFINSRFTNKGTRRKSQFKVVKE